MKVAKTENYGGPEAIKLRDAPNPKVEGRQILVQIHSSTVSSADSRVRSLRVPKGFGLLIRLMFGWSAPKDLVLGTEFSGRIKAVGSAVKLYNVGDRVYGYTGSRFGCHAEFLVVTEDSCIARIPPHLNISQAAGCSFGAMAAWDFLIGKGGLALRTQIDNNKEPVAQQQVLILGAAGAVGSAATRLARDCGVDVTAACSSAKAPSLQAMGAHHIIDYTQQDPLDGSQRYDIILDTLGLANRQTLNRALKPGGKALRLVSSLPDLLLTPLYNLFSNRKHLLGNASERPEDFLAMHRWIHSSHFTPLIDSEFTLSEISAAHRKVDSGRKLGNVIINMEHTAG